MLLSFNGHIPLVLVYLSLWFHPCEHKLPEDDVIVLSKEPYLNQTSLLMSYVLVCGYDFLCNKTDLAFPVYVNDNYGGMNLCPQCHCDNECFFRGDCCPDLFFKFPPLTCIDPDIMSYAKEDTPTPNYLMTNVCPPGTDQELEEKCTRNLTLAEKLLSSPVTSTTDIPITYKNRHCARCNGVYDFDNWDLQIGCDKFADFNFLSTYQEIIDLAIDRSCTITFENTSSTALICDITGDNDEDSIYSECNVTGTWDRYDRDIDMACSSRYENNYGIFKNIFCFLCNPQEFVNIYIISQCNVTGMWEMYHDGLENACLHLPESASTRPFKNIFCYLCNTHSNYETFLDAGSDVYTYENIIDSTFIYNFRLSGFRRSYLLFHLTENAQNTSDLKEYTVNENFMYNDNMRKDNINMTNLMSVISQFNGRGVCNDSFGTKVIPQIGNINTLVLQTCECKPMCRGSCCNDFALTYPLGCVSNDIYSTIINDKFDSILVVNGCFREKYLIILNQLCNVKPNNVSSVYELLPVNLDGVSYRNLFCSLCNEENIKRLDDITEANIFQVQPWDVEISCDSYIDYRHHLLLFSVVNTARDLGCEIKLVPPTFGIRYCSHSYYDVGHCNMSGNWENFNPNVKWSCEELEPYRLPTVKMDTNFLTYKNEYCIICNEHSSTKWINKCNATGAWLMYSFFMEYQCETNSINYNTFPYKNGYCKACNPIPYNPTVPTFPPATHTGLPSVRTSAITIPTSLRSTAFTIKTTIKTTIQPTNPANKGTFRSLFALGRYDIQTPGQSLPKTCTGTQYMDESKDICRNLTCFPGKVLNDRQCDPLLFQTKNLRYILGFRLQVNASLELPTLEFLDNTSAAIIWHLQKVINIERRDFDVEEFQLLIDKPCDIDNLVYNVSDMNIRVHLKIFIKNLVPRKETEVSLLKYMSSTFNIAFANSQNMSMTSQILTDPMMIPLLKHQVNYDQECLVTHPADGKSVKWQKRYRSAYVVNLLICRQIQFESDEFELDWTGLNLKIKSYGIALKYDEFQIMPDTRARVCLSTVVNYMKKSLQLVEMGKLPLVLLTRVCLIVSLVCVVLTFCTYCIFPDLRTLPGKGNMLLMFSLFCAHLCFLLLGEIKLYSTECTVIGILAHYFWLCLFANFNVCCFNIYRIFSGSFNYIDRNANGKKTLVKMALFSFGVPALLVAANAIVTYVVTAGESIGYGGNLCFITHKTSFLVTLFSPMVLMSLSNLVCFLTTACMILQRPKLQKNKSDKYEFLVYVRLFAVTGSAWVLQILDSFLPMSVLSYIIAVLNGLQGLFLFLSYVCKTRVFLMYRSLCFGQNTESSTASFRSSEITRESKIE